MAMPTVPPIVLTYKSEMNFTEAPGRAHLRKPKVPVDVAISLRGIAACSAMRGIWKQISIFESDRKVEMLYLE